MARPFFIAFLLFYTITSSEINGAGLCIPGTTGAEMVLQDTIDRQILYSGRVWRNIYSRVIGDQYLFTREFIPGTVTIGGKTYGTMPIRYDIYNDEIMTITDRNMVIQLNREIVEMFSFRYNGKDYKFLKIDQDSLNTISGYVNVLFDGELSLYIKYKKEISLLAVDNKYDQFLESYKVYLKKDGRLYSVSGNSEVLRIMKDRKKQVKRFMRENNLNLSKKNPENFVPVIEYYITLYN
jgi:hypothetical protein